MPASTVIRMISIKTMFIGEGVCGCSFPTAPNEINILEFLFYDVVGNIHSYPSRKAYNARVTFSGGRQAMSVGFNTVSRYRVNSQPRKYPRLLCPITEFQSPKKSEVLLLFLIRARYSFLIFKMFSLQKSSQPF
ncbi:hypothetical protein SDC9_156766 [bioreactor metagenome]|uniref:Uncharacterized protein n=1 Tax=bioreactor metagenome TaxID=1076179 RepID=A0A645F743_9ZZZZ